MQMSKKTRRKIAHGLSYLFLSIVGITMIFPLVWMFLTSVKSPGADVLSPSHWLPEISWRVNKYDIYNYVLFCRNVIKNKKLMDMLDKKSKQIFVAISRRDPTPVKPGEKPRANQLILESEKSAIVASINAILQRQDFYEKVRTEHFKIPERAKKLASLSDKQSRLLFNRYILDSLFPNDIRPARRFHWENYKIVIFKINFARALFNSIFVTLAITFGLVFTSSLAAFAFSRLNFFGRDKIFLSYLATMMIPSAVTMIPVFILMRQLGWVNTYKALIFPAMFSAYGTFMLRQFFMSIPRALEEAALLDGCSVWGIYWNVVLPLSRPALAALSILTFMGAWRGFMWPLIVTNTRDMFTLPVALAAFKELHGVQWTLMMAGSMIMILPMIIVFIVGQRFFIEGIRLGAVKG